jgi:hypothetical protein
MPGVTKCGDSYATQYVTGPQRLLLMLELREERIHDPVVAAVDVCPIYGCPTDAVVQCTVLAGTDEANAEFETQWHPFAIRYSYSGWDIEQCNLMRWAAYNIVKELALRGPDGIEVVSAVQRGFSPS